MNGGNSQDPSTLNNGPKKGDSTNEVSIANQKLTRPKNVKDEEGIGNSFESQADDFALDS